MSSRDQAMSLAPLLLCSSASITALAHRALLDAFLEGWTVHDPLHENPGCVDMVGVDCASFDQMLDLHYRDPPGCRHHRIEVACRLSVDEITLAIGLPSMNDREVGDEASFHHITLAIEFADFL